MIVPAGVLVDTNSAPLLARLLAAHVRAERVTHDPTLRLLDELQAVSEPSVRGVRNIDTDTGRWCSCAEAAVAYGVTAHTVARWARERKITARPGKDGRTWRIERNGEGGSLLPNALRQT